MLADLVALCRQTVTLEPRSSVDGYGVPSYGTAVTHRARVSGQRKLVRTALGDQVLSTHTVWFASSPVIYPHDRLTLSTGDVQSTESGARQPPILAVSRQPDELGRLHTTVYLA